ncbi:MAG: BPL-N domain-containing protein [Desulfobacterales bacterium]|jgi:glutamine amidotransferase-like uncharacterized protein
MAFAAVYDQYAAANDRLARGERLFFSGREGPGRITDRRTPGSRLLRYPKIGIFAGEGTSHSWLWFVDLFDRMGFHDLSFLEESAVQEGGLEGLDVLAVSGGDTFSIAAALGATGARKIKTFIENGGLYIGSCAGAYLPMNSSKPPLNLFNFAAVKITNLSKLLPECHQMTYKFSTAYGCCYVFHPVREAIGVRLKGSLPFVGTGSLTAPLYGGPGMFVSDTDQVLAHYENFTTKTVFLVDAALACETLIGKAAAVRVPFGSGCLYLFGPHFEHPHYPQANRLVADTVFWDTGSSTQGAPPQMKAEKLSESISRELTRDLKRELSNSRIVAAGLDMLPVRWLIGSKSYEPEKIRVFLESMWRRIKPLEAHGRLCTNAGSPAELLAYATETTALLRLMKNELNEKRDTLCIARRLFALLRSYTVAFLRLYFLTVSETN